MPQTVHIEAGKLGARIRQDGKGYPGAVKKAIFSAMHRGRSYIVGRTPVDRGILRNAWKVVSTADGAELLNDAPYAGIMERGARPFKISKAGLEALTGWVKRKILDGGMGFFTGNQRDRKQAISWAVRKQRAENKMINRAMKRGSYGPKRDTSSRRLRAAKVTQVAALEQEAKSIAYAIAKHFERVGMKGKRFVYLALPTLAKLMDAEVSRSLEKFFNRT
jgi:hypothetical protein